MKTVLITGCSSGVGFEAALAFARAGDRVFASVRTLPGADALLAAAEKEGVAIDIIELDVTRPETFDDRLSRVLAKSGRIDVLVNNAAILTVGAFEDASPADLRAVFETNFFGPALLTRAVLPVMRQQNSGLIIMMSSLSGIASRPGDAVYAASKFALEGLTEGIRHEVDRWNIKVALVEAGQIKTSIFAKAGRAASPPDSPYKPFNDWLKQGLNNAADGAAPRATAELMVEISRSDGSRLRWLADETAEGVHKTLFAQDDQQRDAFLRSVSGVDWWSLGRPFP